MSTATIAAGAPRAVPTIAQTQSGMAARLRSLRTMRLNADSIRAAASGARESLMSVARATHTEGAVLFIGSAISWAASKLSWVRTGVSILGARALLTYGATTEGGQRFAGRVLRFAVRPISYVSMKAYSAVSWLLRHGGRPGIACDNGLAKAIVWSDIQVQRVREFGHTNLMPLVSPRSWHVATFRRYLGAVMTIRLIRFLTVNPLIRVLADLVFIPVIVRGDTLAGARRLGRRVFRGNAVTVSEEVSGLPTDVSLAGEYDVPADHPLAGKDIVHTADGRFLDTTGKVVDTALVEAVMTEAGPSDLVEVEEPKLGEPVLATTSVGARPAGNREARRHVERQGKRAPGGQGGGQRPNR